MLFAALASEVVRFALADTLVELLRRPKRGADEIWDVVHMRQGQRELDMLL